MNGFLAILRKEAIHLLRDRSALGFALFIPIFQLILFGLIDTNVHDVPTATLDLSRSAESRELLQELENTDMFEITLQVDSQQELREAIVSGRVSVGVEIPTDYARRRLEGGPADFRVLIDGSDSSVSGQTLGAVNGVALSKSMEELARRAGVTETPLRAFPLLLFNPDSRSAVLLIPGLVAILLMFSGTILASFSIVREREHGTLEQLMVTPVSPIAVVVGKLLPYLAFGFVQLLVILSLMTTVFRVPIQGSVPLLLGLSLIYLFALLSLGLLISAKSLTQMEAIQRAQAFMLPSIFLSGYVFPIASLPEFLQHISKVLPATHFIAISRGIIIRGASLQDLWGNVAALLAISTVLVLASARAFKKTMA